MQAYAVLAGGGVKGIALAGCLKAAEEANIHFSGYAGTSAGSIVAFLACLGYSGDQLRAIVAKEVNLASFLDDGGSQLHNTTKIKDDLGFNVRTLLHGLRHRHILRRIDQDLGIYEGRPLQQYLYRKLSDKLPSIRQADQVTFTDLLDFGLPLLKVVATDVSSRSARVFSASGGAELNGYVIDAIRASISYPFVFKPVQMNTRYLVDGGVSANLPYLLFETSRSEVPLPVLAFDLITPRGPSDRRFNGIQFASELIGTALESSQRFPLDILGSAAHDLGSGPSGPTVPLLRVMDSIYVIGVRIPQGIDTFNFDLSATEKDQLFEAGYTAARSVFQDREGPWTFATSTVRWLQEFYGPPSLIRPLIQAFASEVETSTPVTNVRASVTLPTGTGTRIVVYQYGMDDDSDEALELPLEAGCSGAAWSTRSPMWANLEDAKTEFLSWGMTEDQQKRVRSDRQTMFSIPIFDPRQRPVRARTMRDGRILGVLSIDTDTPFNATLWITERRDILRRIAEKWADTLGLLFA